MKIIFAYDQEKDIWNLLNYGKGSHNRAVPTVVYEKLVNFSGGEPTESSARDFIPQYLKENDVVLAEYIAAYQKDWNSVANEYLEPAEKIWGFALPQDVTAYLSINNRCPYDIFGGTFYMTVPALHRLRQTVMHELWHFYTWYKFGFEWEEKLGKAKYNDLKEALTVILNIEFRNLMPEGATDKGYPQHAELREKITEIWNETRDIEAVWNRLV